MYLGKDIMILLDKVRKTMVRHAMVERGGRLLVAVSGGPDSVALLHLLAMMASEYELSLVVAHLNHGLRGKEADREESFVRRMSQEMGLKCVSRKVDIITLKEPGKSMEELCRDQRYTFLQEAATAVQATKIALGHHLDDQAETVLMHLLRGSGAEGLHGMLPQREGMIIRPLLEVTRKEILSFLTETGLTSMDDSSNAHDCHLRNRIRHHLLPLLQDGYNPQIAANLSRTAEIMRLDDDYLAAEVEIWLKEQGIVCGTEGQSLALPEFLKLHEAIQQRIIRTLLSGILPFGKGISYRHVKAVLALAKGCHGSADLDLPGGVLLRREYERLVFARRSCRGHAGVTGRSRVLPHYCYALAVPGVFHIPEAGATISLQWADRPSSFLPDTLGVGVALLDYDALRPPLVIRNVLPGDRMQPLGMAGTKKLKSIFIDDKIPWARRRHLPLLADRESIIWLASGRISERARVTEKTRLVLNAEIV